MWCGECCIFVVNLMLNPCQSKSWSRSPPLADEKVQKEYNFLNTQGNGTGIYVYTLFFSSPSGKAWQARTGQQDLCTGSVCTGSQYQRHGKAHVQSWQQVLQGRHPGRRDPAGGMSA